MGLKRLGNTGEHKSFRIIDGTLRDIGFTVNRQSKLDDVIEIDDSPLNKQEKQALHKASFDFVVYDQESIPQFAVEFDGPCDFLALDKLRVWAEQNLHHGPLT